MFLAVLLACFSPLSVERCFCQRRGKKRLDNPARLFLPQGKSSGGSGDPKTIRKRAKVWLPAVWRVRRSLPVRNCGEASLPFFFSCHLTLLFGVIQEIEKIKIQNVYVLVIPYVGL